MNFDDIARAQAALETLTLVGNQVTHRPSDALKEMTEFLEKAKTLVMKETTRADFLEEHLCMWRDNGVAGPKNELQSIALWLRTLGQKGSKETGNIMRQRMTLLTDASIALYKRGREAEDQVGIYAKRSREHLNNYVRLMPTDLSSDLAKAIDRVSPFDENEIYAVIRNGLEAGTQAAFINTLNVGDIAEIVHEVLRIYNIANERECEVVWSNLSHTRQDECIVNVVQAINGDPNLTTPAWDYIVFAIVNKLKEFL